MCCKSNYNAKNNYSVNAFYYYLIWRSIQDFFYGLNVVKIYKSHQICHFDLPRDNIIIRSVVMFIVLSIQMCSVFGGFQCFQLLTTVQDDFVYRKNIAIIDHAYFDIIINRDGIWLAVTFCFIDFSLFQIANRFQTSYWSRLTCYWSLQQIFRCLSRRKKKKKTITILPEHQWFLSFNAKGATHEKFKIPNDAFTQATFMPHF